MSKQEPILVAAPRRTRFDPLDPSSPIVFRDFDYRHPANHAYALPAGEVCIEEGHGVEGDPARANNPRGNPPIEVYPTSAVAGALREGLLVEVRPKQSTADLAMSEDDLASLRSLTPALVKALTAARFEGVSDLAEKLGRAENPVAVLTSVKGIGDAKAADILNELEARGS